MQCACGQKLSAKDSQYLTAFNVQSEKAKYVLKEKTEAGEKFVPLSLGELARYIATYYEEAPKNLKKGEFFTLYYTYDIMKAWQNYSGSSIDRAKPPEDLQKNFRLVQVIRRATKAWEDVIKVRFQERPYITSDKEYDETIKIGFCRLNGVAGFYQHLSKILLINIDETRPDILFSTAIHELGHALRLFHPGPYNASSEMGNVIEIQSSFDHSKYTVMSYNEGNEFGDNISAVSPGIIDILAAASIYGLRESFRQLDDVYKVGALKQGVTQTIFDTGGINTLDASDYIQEVVLFDQGVTINLNPKKHSSAVFKDNVAISHNTKIHNAIGTNYDDVIIGNRLNNTMQGGKGIDCYAVQAPWGVDIIDDLQDKSFIFLKKTYRKDFAWKIDLLVT